VVAPTGCLGWSTASRSTAAIEGLTVVTVERREIPQQRVSSHDRRPPARWSARTRYPLVARRRAGGVREQRHCVRCQPQDMSRPSAAAAAATATWPPARATTVTTCRLQSGLAGEPRDARRPQTCCAATTHNTRTSITGYAASPRRRRCGWPAVEMLVARLFASRRRTRHPA
jgi:hypothetical protein